MKRTSMAMVAASMMVASVASVANAQQTPSFLQGFDAVPMTPSEMDEIRGEAIPFALVVAVRAAPSLNALLSSAIRNHFPLMLIRHAWEQHRGR